ncbi:MAG: bacillithiol biosynthesis deacetylase BshB1 [Acidobacteria bacterium RIFCSPLOWO2_02_FULL_67_36]|nr:MAG: bacillithiol biosynthesis deacetylase BshB1 [Acidobacteria bacterium RIFCSPLOWO2_02_FULL_67_36]
MEPVDLLAFGPHPDDIEIGLGGTVALHVAMGLEVGLCDLTRGELGSNGTPEDRQAEAEAARGVLGAAWRVNLEWPDGGITGNEAQIASAARLIRQCRPRTIALPYWDDRHPDHRAASDALTRAAFKAALRRFSVEGDDAAPWRADWVVYYFINDSVPVSFAVDVSAHYDRKQRALACYRTQFAPSDPGSVPTRLTAPAFAQLIESRDRHLGALTGAAFAEGLIVREPLVRPHAMKGLNPQPPAREDRP